MNKDFTPFLVALFCIMIICGITSVIFHPKDKSDSYYDQDLKFSNEAEKLYWIFWVAFLVSFWVII